MLAGHSQVIHPINHTTVIEMEAVQTPSGAFVTALMESDTAVSSGNYLAVYRSTDNGVSWDSVTSILNNKPGNIADPVMTIDSSGVISLVAMSNPPKNSWNECHLRLYQSIDDGMTWQLKGEPYSGTDMADYPQIISSGSGKLHMTYTLYTPNSFINYIASSDGGTTWSTPVTFTAPFGGFFQSVGCDLGITGNNAFCLAFGDYNHDSIYFSISIDSGLTWQPLDAIPRIIEFTVNKMISRKGLVPIGIISHQPHTLVSPLFFSVSHNQGSTWTTTTLCESAAYGEGFLDTAGIFHVVYNMKDSSEFKLIYTYSDDGGAIFKDPITLYSGENNVNWSTGEYQSLILAKDDLFHLTFVDNSDSAHAKQILFAPLLEGIRQQTNENTMPRIFPNPVHDVLNIELPPGSDFTEYEITDILGKKLQSGKLKKTATQIRITQKENGLLVLKLKASNRILVCKILK